MKGKYTLKAENKSGMQHGVISNTITGIVDHLANAIQNTTLLKYLTFKMKF